MDVGELKRGQAVGSSSGLADVDGGAEVVDGEVVGGYERGELKKLIEVALPWKWDHDHYNFLMRMRMMMRLLFHCCNNLSSCYVV